MMANAFILTVGLIVSLSLVFLVTGPMALLVSVLLNVSWAKVWVSWFLVQVFFSLVMAAYNGGEDL